MNYTLRKAIPQDIEAITALFRTTILEVNAGDYSDAHLKVWASGADDLAKWENRIAEHYFIVAENESTLVGFAYLTNGNYFDGLFVHKAYQGFGIASTLLKHIEQKVIENKHTSIHSDVSITALPFFKKYNYVVERKQQKEFKDLIFENYIVSKTLV